MGSKTFLLFILLVMLPSAMLGVRLIVPVAGTPRTKIEVPRDYETIQAAIDAANLGDTIFVHAGTYNENLTVDKWLKLIGEDKETTIIDANGTGNVIYVEANGVYISGFTIQNGKLFPGIYLRETYSCVIEDSIFKCNLFGVYMFHSTRNRIVNNLMTDNQYGVRMYCSSWNTIADNNITSTYFYCISLYGDSSENSICGNTILNNVYRGSCGIHIGNNDLGNTIYHNSFINNTVQVMINNQTATWDNGVEGNYWSDYDGTDANGDGIGDSPYIIDENNQDIYPLMSPYWYWSNPTPGDINKNMKVDYEDLNLIKAAYLSKPNEPNWNPNADLDGNGLVDSMDVIFGLAPNYGTTYC